MEKKLVLELNKHNVYYVKDSDINYYITVPKDNLETSICIELKSKMDNYNIEMNDEIWVMENVKTTFSYIDDYNITLVLPVLSDEYTSILEKMDNDKFEIVDKTVGKIINSSYNILKNENKEIDKQIVIVNNDRFKVFINWFTTRYKERIIRKNLLELIQHYNVNATSYKKYETPAMTFVVGSYNTEVNAPRVIKEQESVQTSQKLVPQTSSGFTSYWLLAIITLVVSSIVALIAFLS